MAAELELAEEEVLEPLEAAPAYDSLSLDAARPGGEDPDDSLCADSIGEEDGRFELVERGATMAPALRGLPESDRRILRMRFVEGMTQSQIGAKVGLSKMQVSRLVRRSLARLVEATEA